MISWIRRLFKKDYYREPRFTLGKIIGRYIICEREHTSMSGYIREHQSCQDCSKLISKKLLRRYNLNIADINILSWYLLEQYFQGNIEIKTKEDAQPK